MKIKILNNLSYQSFPIVEGMIEINDKDLREIGKTKQFDVENKTVIDYIPPIDNREKISKIKNRLDQLSEDIIQDQAGEFVPNIKERKAEFIHLHNELRQLEGKQPRILK